MEIGLLKVREAEAAIRSFTHGAKISETEMSTLNAMLSRMRNGTLTNLRLGLGHHSPDYQWWYGQAALDGDLLRIKALITRFRREKKQMER